MHDAQGMVLYPSLIKVELGLLDLIVFGGNGGCIGDGVSSQLNPAEIASDRVLGHSFRQDSKWSFCHKNNPYAYKLNRIWNKRMSVLNAAFTVIRIDS